MSGQIITAPEGVVSARVEQGQRLGFTFDIRTEAAAFERDGGSLIVTLKNGGKIILENFFVDAVGGGELPVLVLPDGSEASSAEFLHSVNPLLDVTPVVQLEESRRNKYSDDAGSLVEGDAAHGAFKTVRWSSGSSMPDPVLSPEYLSLAGADAENRTGIGSANGMVMPTMPPFFPAGQPGQPGQSGQSGQSIVPALSIGNAVVTEGGDLVFTVTQSIESGVDTTADWPVTIPGADVENRTGIGSANGLVMPPMPPFFPAGQPDQPGESGQSNQPGQSIVPALSISNAEITEGGLLSFSVTQSVASEANTTAGWSITLPAASTPGTASYADLDADQISGNGNGTGTSSGNVNIPAGSTTLPATSTPGTVSFDDLDLDPDKPPIGIAITRDGDTVTVSGSILIPAGSTTATISIPTKDDAVFELDETLTITLGNPENAGIADDTGDGTVLNNDEGTIIESERLFLLYPNVAQSTLLNLPDYITPDGISLENNSGSVTLSDGKLYFTPNDFAVAAASSGTVFDYLTYMDIGGTTKYKVQIVLSNNVPTNTMDMQDPDNQFSAERDMVVMQDAQLTPMSLNTGAGNDTVSISGDITTADNGEVTINGGEGNDTLRANLNHLQNIVKNENSICGFEHLILNAGDESASLNLDDSLFASLFASLFGVDGNGENELVINGGTGDDTITGDAVVSTATRDDKVSINGGDEDGADTITLGGVAVGASSHNARVSVSGGAGSDSISINADQSNMDGLSIDGSCAEVTVDGGEGDDVITIGGGQYAIRAQYSYTQAAVYGGGGNDAITIVGGQYALYANEHSGANVVVDGGDGNDNISIRASGTDSNALYALGRGSTAAVDGGGGNDVITIDGGQYALYADSPGYAFGEGSTAAVYGGGGNDVITIDGGQCALYANSIGSNAVVDGGDDNDTITINGNIKTDNSDRAEVNGGNGDDKITFNGIITGDSAWILGGEGDDTLSINSDNMNNIVINKEHISGFEHVILDLKDIDVILDNSLLSNLTRINGGDDDVSTNTLIITSSAGNASVTLNDTDLLATVNDPISAMEGYYTYSYTNNTTYEDALIYIQTEINIITGGG